MKKCTKCKEEKPATLEYFGPRKESRDGLNSHCRICRYSSFIKFYQVNKEKFRDRWVEYYGAHKEEIAERTKEYWARPEIKIRQKEYFTKRSSHYKALTKRWVANNREQAMAIVAKHRNAKKQATPKWLSRMQLEEIKQYYCDARELSWLSEGGLAVDHIVPIQGKFVCGLHVPWNLRVIPFSENSSKGNRFEHAI